MNEHTVLRVIGWVVLYFVGSIIAELLLEFTDALSREDELRPAAVAWFVLLGLAGGLRRAG